MNTFLNIAAWVMAPVGLYAALVMNDLPIYAFKAFTGLFA